MRAGETTRRPVGVSARRRLRLGRAWRDALKWFADAMPVFDGAFDQVSEQQIRAPSPPQPNSQRPQKLERRAQWRPAVSRKAGLAAQEARRSR